MRSSDGKRFVYEKSPLVEVICQLRYPPILSIDTKTPADFQDTVRESFPRYQRNVEKGKDGEEVRNHAFISEDGGYKLSLTRSFIALSTMRYTNWEDFALMLDEPLGQFIRLYRPAYFERVGLRYINAVNRTRLELQGRRWNDLFQPQYLGVLDDDGVDETQVNQCSVDVQMRLDERSQLKLHAGPGRLSRTVKTREGLRNIQDPEVHFIFDQDLYAGGNIKLPGVMETLSSLHRHADRLFSEAITDVLHTAMEPVEVSA